MYLKNKFLPIAVFLILAVAGIVSCQKELTGDSIAPNPTLPPDLVTQVTSSVASGFVTDEAGAAINGALVRVGSTTTTTNKYGYFEVKNVRVVQNAAVVIASKPGYFNGIKTYIAKGGKGAFFRIARAIATRCFSPPLNFNPLSPTMVSYPSGKLIMVS